MDLFRVWQWIDQAGMIWLNKTQSLINGLWNNNSSCLFVWYSRVRCKAINKLCFYGAQSCTKWRNMATIRGLPGTQKRNSLRILAMYEAKNSTIYDFWTFWPVIQLINHLISWITAQDVQNSQILLFFAPYIASILKEV